jgi:hypothetical protein
MAWLSNSELARLLAKYDDVYDEPYDEFDEEYDDFEDEFFEEEFEDDEFEDDNGEFDDNANSTELRQMAEAMTHEVITAMAENREPRLPEGWTGKRIASNLGKLMEDLDLLDDYVDMLDAVQEARGVKDPEMELTDELLLDQIEEEGLESFLTHLSDGDLVLVAASPSALESIWCDDLWVDSDDLDEESDDPFES